MPPKGSKKKTTSVPPAVGTHAQNFLPPTPAPDPNLPVPPPRNLSSAQGSPQPLEGYRGPTRVPGPNRDFSSAPPLGDPVGGFAPDNGSRRSSVRSLSRASGLRPPAEFTSVNDRRIGFPAAQQQSYQLPPLQQQQRYQLPPLQPQYQQQQQSQHPQRKHAREPSFGASEEGRYDKTVSPQRAHVASAFRGAGSELSREELLRLLKERDQAERVPDVGEFENEGRGNFRPEFRGWEQGAGGDVFTAPAARVGYATPGGAASFVSPERRRVEESPAARQLNEIVRQPDSASDIESRLPAFEDLSGVGDDEYHPEGMPPKGSGARGGRTKSGSRTAQQANARKTAQRPQAGGDEDAEDDEYQPKKYAAGDTVPKGEDAQRDAYAQWMGGMEEDLIEMMCAACAVNLTVGKRKARDPCNVNARKPCARCAKSNKNCIIEVSRALRLLRS